MMEDSETLEECCLEFLIEVDVLVIISISCTDM